MSANDEAKELEKLNILLEKYRLSHLDVSEEFQDHFNATQAILEEIKMADPKSFPFLKERYLQEIKQIQKKIEAIQEAYFQKVNKDLRLRKLEYLQLSQYTENSNDESLAFKSKDFYPLKARPFYVHIFKFLFRSFTKAAQQSLFANRNNHNQNLSKQQSTIEAGNKTVNKKQVRQGVRSQYTSNESNVNKKKHSKQTLLQQSVKHSGLSKNMKVLQSKTNASLKLKEAIQGLLSKSEAKTIQNLERKKKKDVFVKEIDVEKASQSKFQSRIKDNSLGNKKGLKDQDE